jgi:hypothetical protein
MLIAAGIIFTAIAAIGGGFSAREISVPQVPIRGRLMSGVMALAFFTAAGYLIQEGRTDLVSVSGTQTEMAPGGQTTPSPRPSPSPPPPEATQPPEQPPPTEAPPAVAGTSTDAPDSAADVQAAPGPAASVSNQQRLLGFVPAALSDHCERSDFGLEELGTMASLECFPPSGATQVDFHWFPTPERMAAILTKDADSAAPLTADDCTPDTWSHRGLWGIDNSDDVVGEELCFLRNGKARVVWTYQEHNVFAHAVRDDGDVYALHDWWRQVRQAVGQGPDG